MNLCISRKHGNVEEEGRDAAEDGKQGEQGLLHVTQDPRRGAGRSVNINKCFLF